MVEESNTTYTCSNFVAKKTLSYLSCLLGTDCSIVRPEPILWRLFPLSLSFLDLTNPLNEQLEICFRLCADWKHLPKQKSLERFWKLILSSFVRVSRMKGSMFTSLLLLYFPSGKSQKRIQPETLPNVPNIPLMDTHQVNFTSSTQKGAVLPRLSDSVPKDSHLRNLCCQKKTDTGGNKYFLQKRGLVLRTKPY